MEIHQQSKDAFIAENYILEQYRLRKRRHVFLAKTSKATRTRDRDKAERASGVSIKHRDVV